MFWSSDGLAGSPRAFLQSCQRRLCHPRGPRVAGPARPVGRVGGLRWEMSFPFILELELVF